MKWTRERSLRAHAAKERLRIERANAAQDIPKTICRPARHPAADFVIWIKTRLGERIQIAVWRFGRKLIFSDGSTSARQFCRGLEHILTKSA